MPKLLPMTAEDKKWQEEGDARTLAEAEVIKNTKSRANGAKKAASRMAADKEKEANAMRKVAKTKPDKPVKAAKKTAKRPSRRVQGRKGRRR